VITNISFEQYHLDIAYDVVPGDFYAADYLDWHLIGGFVTNEDEEILDDSFDFIYGESLLLEKYISEILRKELGMVWA